MPTVRDILSKKGTNVLSTTVGRTVLETAKLMNERGIGGVVVVDDAKQLLGIFTERDILRRVVVEALDPATTTIEEVYTKNAITVLPDTTLDECSAIMTAKRIRHLPVADASTVYGIVTIGDVLAFRVSEHETTIEFLNSYMFGTR